MGVEAATYISDLNASNPVGASDLYGFGDTHLRLIKNVLANSFQSITGAVTSTHTELNIVDGVTATAAELNIADGLTVTAAELNYLVGVTSAIQTQINTKLAALTTQSKSSNFDAVAGYHYLIQSGVTTITLPASPVEGNQIKLSNTTAIAKIVSPNGKNINGASGSILLGNRATMSLIYFDATTGWVKHSA